MHMDNTSAESCIKERSCKYYTLSPSCRRLLILQLFLSLSCLFFFFSRRGCLLYSLPSIRFLTGTWPVLQQCSCYIMLLLTFWDVWSQGPNISLINPTVHCGAMMHDRFGTPYTSCSILLENKFDFSPVDEEFLSLQYRTSCHTKMLKKETS